MSLEPCIARSVHKIPNLETDANRFLYPSLYGASLSVFATGLPRNSSFFSSPDLSSDMDVIAHQVPFDNLRILVRCQFVKHLTQVLT